MNGVGCASKLHAQSGELEPRACSAYRADVCLPETILELFCSLAMPWGA